MSRITAGAPAKYLLGHTQFGKRIVASRNEHGMFVLGINGGTLPRMLCGSFLKLQDAINTVQAYLVANTRFKAAKAPKTEAEAKVYIEE